MATDLTVEQSFPSSPADVYALLLDIDVLARCVVAVGGDGATVVTHDGDENGVTITTSTPVDPSTLPAALRPMIGSNAKGTKSEKWARHGDGYTAEFSISVPGAPATVTAQAQLGSHSAGSQLTIKGSVEVKVPVLGPKIERLLVDQISARLAAEYQYLCGQLS
ncbi:MAG: DUF2505 domain-containing protein [Marmoricola sp.]